eukprot:scaffold27312_cov31-Tisochrysis_lutea.AAC.3
MELETNQHTNASHVMLGAGQQEFSWPELKFEGWHSRCMEALEPVEADVGTFGGYELRMLLAQRALGRVNGLRTGSVYTNKDAGRLQRSQPRTLLGTIVHFETPHRLTHQRAHHAAAVRKGVTIPFGLMHTERRGHVSSSPHPIGGANVPPRPAPSFPTAYPSL